MAEFTKHPLEWAKEHPYIAVAGGVVAVGIIWLIWPSSSSSNTNPGQTFQQQTAWQRLIGNQQLAAMRIQQKPALASIAGQNHATAWQGRLGLAGLSEQTTLANIQAQEMASQQQQQTATTGYLAYLQYIIARMAYGFNAGSGGYPGFFGGVAPGGFGGNPNQGWYGP